jgi:hypothetical protein
MPHNPKNFQSVPAPLEPKVLKAVEAAADKHNFPRNRLIRMFVKYGLKNLPEVLKQGDPHYK